MEELKSKVMEVLNGVNQIWVNALKKAEEKGEGVDLTEIFGDFSVLNSKLDQYFREAKARNINKNRSFFGR